MSLASLRCISTSKANTVGLLIAMAHSSSYLVAFKKAGGSVLEGRGERALARVSRAGGGHRLKCAVGRVHCPSQYQAPRLNASELRG
eukprot:5323542-Pyramimonas_sp.AAC.1